MRTLLITGAAAVLLFSAFTTNKKIKPKLPGEFVLVPGGTFHYPRSEKEADRISLRSFYISKYEVSNLQYRRFFSETAPGLTREEQEKINCDTSGWNSQLYCAGAAYQTSYYRLPAFNNYPVVNISYEGASKYCEWLQRIMQKNNPGFIVEVKLPSKEQWVYAAMGGRSQAMFPWNHWYFRNKKGEYLCNFRKVADYAITRNRKTGLPDVHEATGNTDFQMPVNSFSPNDYGLYNMCGNVAEMINQKSICMGGSWNDYGGDVNTTAEARYEKSNATTGFRPIIIVTEK